MFSVRSPGSFSKTETFLKKIQRGDIYRSLEAQAELGVSALAQATPRDTGETAQSWSYKITKSRNTWQIVWTNTNTVNGEPIAIMLQYGHGTGTGGYVAGRDYINPAMQPTFDKIADNVWKEVMRV